MQAKTAYAAKQVPHMAYRQRPHPLTCRGVQRAGDDRIGLKETLRADPQRHAVEIFRQRLLLSQKDFRLPFHNGHMYRLDIHRNHVKLRQLRL